MGELYEGGRQGGRGNKGGIRKDGERPANGRHTGSLHFLRTFSELSCFLFFQLNRVTVLASVFYAVVVVQSAQSARDPIVEPSPPPPTPAEPADAQVQKKDGKEKKCGCRQCVLAEQACLGLMESGRGCIRCVSLVPDIVICSLADPKSVDALVPHVVQLPTGADSLLAEAAGIDDGFRVPDGPLVIRAEDIVAAGEFPKRSFLGIARADVALETSEKKKARAKIDYLAILKKAPTAPAAGKWSESDSDGSDGSDGSSSSGSSEDSTVSATSSSTGAAPPVMYAWLRTKGQKAKMDVRTRQLFWKQHGSGIVTVTMAAVAHLPECSGTVEQRHKQLQEDETHPKYLFGEDKSKWAAGCYPASVSIKKAGTEKRAGPEGGQQTRGPAKKSRKAKGGARRAPKKRQPECQVCLGEEAEKDDLLCDVCDRGFHQRCVGVTGTPAGRWVCAECKKKKDK